MNYRIAYLGETMVNWCPQLGTVLANDEVVDGVSNAEVSPSYRKRCASGVLRVSAYAQRLLDGLTPSTGQIPEGNPTELDRTQRRC